MTEVHKGPLYDWRPFEWDAFRVAMLEAKRRKQRVLLVHQGPAGYVYSGFMDADTALMLEAVPGQEHYWGHYLIVDWPTPDRSSVVPK